MNHGRDAEATPGCADPAHGSRLAAYELGLLAPEEQVAFEAHLGVCDACAEELFAHAPTVAAIHEAPGRVAAGLRPRENAASAGSRARRALKALGDWLAPRTWAEAWRPLLPAAALATLVVLLARSPGGPADLSGLARIEPLPYRRIETRAAGADEGRRLLARGMEAYERASWSEAAGLLARATPLVRDPRAPEAAEQATLLAGVSYLMADRPDSAEICLRPARVSSLPVVADRARWYLAQAALRRGDATAALALLDSLAAGSPGYASRAAEQAREVRGVR
jgi:hypothetical protein